MKPKKQWDHKWYTEEFLQQLKATAAVEMDGDLPYITKYAPDAGSPNGIDPRLLGGPMGKMARSTGLVQSSENRRRYRLPIRGGERNRAQRRMPPRRTSAQERHKP